MTPLRAIVLSLVAVGLLASNPGCASSGASRDGYYTRGAHRDAYPPAGMPGSPVRYGRPRYY